MKYRKHRLCNVSKRDKKHKSIYPLLIQFHQLLGNFGRVECQSEAGEIQLREKVLQHLFDGQPSAGAVLRGGRHSILQDRPPQGCELNSKAECREG